MAAKRTHADMEGKPTNPTPASNGTYASPFMPMFESFRAELDSHHERRERCIKASRDITAASKKIIFTLQRVRSLAEPLPNKITTGNEPYYTTIGTQFRSVCGDLQGLNAYRYARNISGGCQEYIEAATFEHYLTTGTLLSYEQAAGQTRALSLELEEQGDASRPGIELSPEDYVLGVYDMTGELMRFAITAMATSGKLPSPDAEDAQRNILTDMRALRSALESLEPGRGPFAKDADKKMEVMRQSVEKVEKALYGLVVRGAERPAGWMPDTSDNVRTVEVES